MLYAVKHKSIETAQDDFEAGTTNEARDNDA
jgi:hypothetical protein